MRITPASLSEIYKFPSEVIGLCKYIGFMKKKFNKVEFQETPVISLDRKSWERSHPILKESLIFHELGHCILKKGHDTSLTSNGYPTSIMYPIILPNSLYAEYYPEYMSNLFNKSSDLFLAEQPIIEALLYE